MTYLTQEELNSVIREHKVTHISDNDPTTVLKAINTGITEVKSRLSSKNDRTKQDGRLKYDVKAIFEEEGDSRNPLILEITKVVSLWWLIMRNNAGIHYDIIRDRYAAAIEYLKDLADGTANDFTLPIISDPIDKDGQPISEAKPFRMGGREKFNHE